MSIKNNLVLLLNFLFSPMLIIFFVLSKQYEIASYFGLTSGFLVFFTQSLSANKRQEIILSDNFELSDKTIFFRCMVSFAIIIITSFILSFKFENSIYITLLLLTIFICIFWIKEIILTELELKKKNKKLYLEASIYLIFYFIIVIKLFYFNSIKYLNLILIFFLFIFFIILFERIIRFKISNVINFNYLLLKFDTSYASSFSIIICNLFWRIMIFIFVGETMAGVFYAAFSIGSLPSTVFVNTFGTQFVKQKNSYKFLFRYLLIYTIFVLICVYIINNFQYIFSLNFQKLLIDLVSFSLVGSILMLIGQYKRKKILFNFFKFKEKIFIHDIIYSSLLSMIPLICFWFGGENVLKLSFLVGSILCFIYYYNLENQFRFYDNKKIK